MSRFLLALLVSLLNLTSAHGAAIRFQVECGFGFVACGPFGVVTLQQNGPAYEYFDPRGGVIPGGVPFSLAYIDDAFVMTATMDFTPGGSTPFGLAVYPGSGPLITRAFPDTTTAYGFIAMNAFPRVAGTSVSIAIPAAEVPEPGTLAMLLAGLGLAGWAGRRRRHHSTGSPT